MAKAEISHWFADDGYCGDSYRYKPCDPRRASVVGLHGIQSHGEWYDDTCRALAAAFFDVTFLDRRGSGLNVKDRGDTLSFRRLLDDIAGVLRDQPRPRFLIGISWGGKLAVALQRRHPGLTDGLVLIAPGLCPRVRPPLGQWVRIVASRLVSPRRQFSIPLNEPELFTENPERRQFIRDDPLALREASARFLFESARMDVYLRFAPRHVTMPVLVLLAGADRIIDNEATRTYVERFAGEDKIIIEYPNAHHTLEFEPGGPPFLGDLLNWLNRRL